MRTGKCPACNSQAELTRSHVPGKAIWRRIDGNQKVRPKLMVGDLCRECHREWSRIEAGIRNQAFMQAATAMREQYSKFTGGRGELRPSSGVK